MSSSHPVTSRTPLSQEMPSATTAPHALVSGREGGEMGFALPRPAEPLKQLKASFANFWRDRKNAKLARKYPKQQIGPYPDHGYAVLTETFKNNGLCRAYRYEIERLKEEGLYNPASRNVLILGQPRQYRKLLKDTPKGFENAYRIGLWVTEFDVMPPDWAFAVDIIHELWTPSTFSAKALAASGLKVTLRPHAVSVGAGTALSRQRFNVPEEAFLGLAIMDLGTCPDRKNPLAHVAAWKMAFGDDPHAILLMKVRFGRRTGFARTALLSAIGAANNIRFIEEEFTDAEMTGFQRMGDVYLSLHRSEGYGLNIHEMLEIGIPAISTGYSGNMTFMGQYAHAFAVPYRLIPYRDPTFHYRGRDLLWADSDPRSAAEFLVAQCAAIKRTDFKEQKARRVA